MKKFILTIALLFSIFPLICFSGGPISGGPIGGGPISEGGGGGSQLIKTGQEITYRPVALDDDGALELGIAPSFTILTTGRYSGTVNLTINGKTHATSNACVKDNNTGKMWHREVIQSDIGPAADGKLFWEQYTITGESVTFNAAAKTITAAVGNPFDTNALCVGRIFTVSGTVNNDGTYTVAVIAGNVITTSEALVNEGPVATDFATVDDLIWDLKDQANAGSGIAGYTDWRIPNQKELTSIIDMGQGSPAINGTIFPSTPALHHWSGTTHSVDSSRAWSINFGSGTVYGNSKNVSMYYMRLVRQGN